MIQCDRKIEARKPGIVVVKHKERSCIIINLSVSGDTRTSKKEKTILEKYQDLKREICRM